MMLRDQLIKIIIDDTFILAEACLHKMVRQKVFSMFVQNVDYITNRKKTYLYAFDNLFLGKPANRWRKYVVNNW